jgi:hypothetical protein
VGAGFHPTSGMRYGRVNGALDHAKLRERGELLQMWPPDVVLERCFRDDRYLARQQQPEHVEEERKRPLGQSVARRRLELATLRMNEPLLDLVAADRRAGDCLGEGVREGRLPRARWAADDDERRRYRRTPILIEPT